MNDELDMQQLTDALRAVGAPPEPPPGYEQIARDAALGDGRAGRGGAHRPPPAAPPAGAPGDRAGRDRGIDDRRAGDRRRRQPDADRAHRQRCPRRPAPRRRSTSARRTAPCGRWSSRSPTCRRRATATTTSCGCRRTARACRSPPSTPTPTARSPPSRRCPPTWAGIAAGSRSTRHDGRERRERPRRAPELARAASILGPRGAIAQLGERLDRTQEVSGSNPLSSMPSESGWLCGKTTRCRCGQRSTAGGARPQFGRGCRLSQRPIRQHWSDESL